jgi:hypothetical protein
LLIVWGRGVGSGISGNTRKTKLRNCAKNLFRELLQSVRLEMPAKVVMGTLGISPFILTGENQSATLNFEKYYYPSLNYISLLYKMRYTFSERVKN